MEPDEDYPTITNEHPAVKAINYYGCTMPMAVYFLTLLFLTIPYAVIRRFTDYKAEFLYDALIWTAKYGLIIGIILFFLFGWTESYYVEEAVGYGCAMWLSLLLLLVVTFLFGDGSNSIVMVIQGIPLVIFLACAFIYFFACTTNKPARKDPYAKRIYIPLPPQDT